MWQKLGWALFLFGLPWWLRLKNLPAMQETWVQSLGWEDPLEEGMATLSSILFEGSGQFLTISLTPRGIPPHPQSHPLPSPGYCQDDPSGQPWAPLFYWILIEKCHSTLGHSSSPSS